MQLLIVSASTLGGIKVRMGLTIDSTTGVIKVWIKHLQQLGQNKLF